MGNHKILVVYFSRPNENYNVGQVEVGNTELLAKEIIKRTGAAEFKIIPEVAYPEGYQETIALATEELNSAARPKYIGDIDTADYDIIFFGYPIWWGDLPMIAYTFLEKHDFTGKTIIPFNTHEGSGNSGTYEKLKEKLPTANIIGDGFNLSGIVSRTAEGISKLNTWLDSLNLAQ